jgi:predicted nucleotidyltransferase
VGDELAAEEEIYMLDLATIAPIANWARSEPTICEVRAFGSRVRGRTWKGGPVRPDSDLDLAVTISLPPTADLAQAQEVWTEMKQRGVAALAAVITWPLHFELLEGERSPNLRCYVADCSRLIYRRPQRTAPPERG